MEALVVRCFGTPNSGQTAHLLENFITSGVPGSHSARRRWLLLGVNAGTAFMFVCLVAFTTIAFLIGFNIGDPVKEGVIEGWPLGGRQEYELGGLCDPVDECKAYYPQLENAMSDWDQIANPNSHQVTCAALDKFELSVNCTRAKDCDYVLGTDPEWGCDNCDDACMKVAIEDARDAMSPLAWGSIFIFSILILVGAYNDFLMERANFGAAGAFDDGEKDTMEWIGVGLNCLIAFFSLVLVILGGVYAGEGSWTALAILFLGIFLLGASVVVAVGLFMQFKLTRLLVFIGNVAIACLSILLLIIAIVAGLSAGVVTDINEELDNHWDSIR
eukprot:SAG31_NODE_876_length_11307_cov_3.506781_14_plen_330_part_00